MSCGQRGKVRICRVLEMTRGDRRRGEEKDQIFTPKTTTVSLKQHILQREWGNVKTGGYIETNSTWCTYSSCVDVLMIWAQVV